MGKRIGRGPRHGFYTSDDIRIYSSLTSEQQVHDLSTVAILRERAAGRALLDRSRSSHQPGGDAEKTFWSEDTTPQQMLVTYPQALSDGLGAFNVSRAAGSHIRMRLAVVQGFVEQLAGNFVGEVPVLATRLVDAAPVKRALELRPDAPLVLVIDDGTYRSLVAQRIAGDPRDFVPIHVEDRQKNVSVSAWLSLPGSDHTELRSLAQDLERDTGSAANSSDDMTRSGSGPRLALPPATQNATPPPDRDSQPQGGRSRAGMIAIIVALIGAAGAVSAAAAPSLLTSSDGSHQGNRNSGPVLAVHGACNQIGQVLSNASSGFTPGGRYDDEVLQPDGNAYAGQMKKVGTVNVDGSVNWSWLCEAGDPIGTYRTRITDDATGRNTGWITFTINVS